MADETFEFSTNIGSIANEIISEYDRVASRTAKGVGLNTDQLSSLPQEARQAVDRTVSEFLRLKTAIQSGQLFGDLNFTKGSTEAIHKLRRDLSEVAGSLKLSAPDTTQFVGALSTGFRSVVKNSIAELRGQVSSELLGSGKIQLRPSARNQEQAAYVRGQDRAINGNVDPRLRQAETKRVDAAIAAANATTEEAKAAVRAKVAEEDRAKTMEERARRARMAMEQERRGALFRSGGAPQTNTAQQYAQTPAGRAQADKAAADARARQETIDQRARERVEKQRADNARRSGDDARLQQEYEREMADRAVTDQGRYRSVPARPRAEEAPTRYDAGEAAQFLEPSTRAVLGKMLTRVAAGFGASMAKGIGTADIVEAFRLPTDRVTANYKPPFDFDPKDLKRNDSNFSNQIGLFRQLTSAERPSTQDVERVYARQEREAAAAARKERVAAAAAAGLKFPPARIKEVGEQAAQQVRASREADPVGALNTAVEQLRQRAEEAAQRKAQAGDKAADASQETAAADEDTADSAKQQRQAQQESTEATQRESRSQTEIAQLAEQGVAMARQILEARRAQLTDVQRNTATAYRDAERKALEQYDQERGREVKLTKTGNNAYSVDADPSLTLRKRKDPPDLLGGQGKPYYQFDTELRGTDEDFNRLLDGKYRTLRDVRAALRDYNEPPGEDDNPFARREAGVKAGLEAASNVQLLHENLTTSPYGIGLDQYRKVLQLQPEAAPIDRSIDRAKADPALQQTQQAEQQVAENTQRQAEATQALALTTEQRLALARQILAGERDGSVGDTTSERTRRQEAERLAAEQAARTAADEQLRARTGNQRQARRPSSDLKMYFLDDKLSMGFSRNIGSSFRSGYQFNNLPYPYGYRGLNEDLDQQTADYKSFDTAAKAKKAGTELIRGDEGPYAEAVKEYAARKAADEVNARYTPDASSLLDRDDLKYRHDVAESQRRQREEALEARGPKVAPIQDQDAENARQAEIQQRRDQFQQAADAAHAVGEADERAAQAARERAAALQELQHATEAEGQRIEAALRQSVEAAESEAASATRLAELGRQRLAQAQQQQARQESQFGEQHFAYARKVLGDNTIQDAHSSRYDYHEQERPSAKGDGTYVRDGYAVYKESGEHQFRDDLGETTTKRDAEAQVKRLRDAAAQQADSEPLDPAARAEVDRVKQVLAQQDAEIARALAAERDRAAGTGDTGSSAPNTDQEAEAVAEYTEALEADTRAVREETQAHHQVADALHEQAEHLAVGGAGGSGKPPVGPRLTGAPDDEPDRQGQSALTQLDQQQKEALDHLRERFLNFGRLDFERGAGGDVTSFPNAAVRPTLADIAEQRATHEGVLADQPHDITTDVARHEKALVALDALEDQLKRIDAALTAEGNADRASADASERHADTVKRDAEQVEADQLERARLAQQYQQAHRQSAESAQQQAQASAEATAEQEQQAERSTQAQRDTVTAQEKRAEVERRAAAQAQEALTAQAAQAAEATKYYHGTTATDLTAVLPQDRHGGHTTFPSDTDAAYGYATTSERDAQEYAEKAYHASGVGVPRVYEVVPLGEVEKDPTTDAQGRSRGNNESDVRSRQGFAVSREIDQEHDYDPETGYPASERDYRTPYTQAQLNAAAEALAGGGGGKQPPQEPPPVAAGSPEPDDDSEKYEQELHRLQEEDLRAQERITEADEKRARNAEEGAYDPRVMTGEERRQNREAKARGGSGGGGGGGDDDGFGFGGGDFDPGDGEFSQEFRQLYDEVTGDILDRLREIRNGILKDLDTGDYLKEEVRRPTDEEGNPTGPAVTGGVPLDPGTGDYYRALRDDRRQSGTGDSLERIDRAIDLFDPARANGLAEGVEKLANNLYRDVRSGTKEFVRTSNQGADFINPSEPRDFERFANALSAETRFEAKKRAQAPTSVNDQGRTPAEALQDIYSEPGKLREGFTDIGDNFIRELRGDVEKFYTITGNKLLEVAGDNRLASKALAQNTKYNAKLEGQQRLRDAYAQIVTDPATGEADRSRSVLRAGLFDIGGGYFRQDQDELGQDVRKFFKQVGTALNDVTGDIAEQRNILKAQASNAARQGIGSSFLSGALSGGFGGEGGTGFQGLARSAGTTLKYTALYSTLGLLQGALSQTGQEMLNFEDSNTNLAIALGQTNDVSQDFINNLQDLAVVAGANVGDFMDIASAGIRSFGDEVKASGGDVDEFATQFAAGVQKMTLLAKTTPQDALGNVRASIAGFQLGPYGIDRVNDAVANAKQFGGDAEDISQGLASFAEGAQSAGFSPELAAALVARVTANSDRGGQAVGTSLTRIATIAGGNAGQRALASVNSILGEDAIDVSGGATPAQQLEQLAAVIGRLTPGQRQLITNQIAGTNSAREFSAAMDFLATTTENSDTITTAAGKSTKEYQRTLDDLTKVLAHATGDFKNILQQISESGILTPLLVAFKATITVMDALLEGLQEFNKISPIFREIGFSVVEVGLALKALNVIAKAGGSGGLKQGFTNFLNERGLGVSTLARTAGSKAEEQRIRDATGRRLGSKSDPELEATNFAAGPAGASRAITANGEAEEVKRAERQKAALLGAAVPPPRIPRPVTPTDLPGGSGASGRRFRVGAGGAVEAITEEDVRLQQARARAVRQELSLTEVGLNSIGNTASKAGRGISGAFRGLASGVSGVAGALTGRGKAGVPAGRHIAGAVEGAVENTAENAAATEAVVAAELAGPEAEIAAARLRAEEAAARSVGQGAAQAAELAALETERFTGLGGTGEAAAVAERSIAPGAGRGARKVGDLGHDAGDIDAQLFGNADSRAAQSRASTAAALREAEARQASQAAAVVAQAKSAEKVAEAEARAVTAGEPHRFTGLSESLAASRRIPEDVTFRGLAGERAGAAGTKIATGAKAAGTAIKGSAVFGGAAALGAALLDPFTLAILGATTALTVIAGVKSAQEKYNAAVGHAKVGLDAAAGARTSAQQATAISTLTNAKEELDESGGGVFGFLTGNKGKAKRQEVAIDNQLAILKANKAALDQAAAEAGGDGTQSAASQIQAGGFSVDAVNNTLDAMSASGASAAKQLAALSIAFSALGDNAEGLKAKLPVQKDAVSQAVTSGIQGLGKDRAPVTFSRTGSFSFGQTGPAFLGGQASGQLSNPDPLIDVVNDPKVVAGAQAAIKTALPDYVVGGKLTPAETAKASSIAADYYTKAYLAAVKAKGLEGSTAATGPEAYALFQAQAKRDLENTQITTATYNPDTKLSAEELANNAEKIQTQLSASLQFVDPYDQKAIDTYYKQAIGGLTNNINAHDEGVDPSALIAARGKLMRDYAEEQVANLEKLRAAAVANAGGDQRAIDAANQKFINEEVAVALQGKSTQALIDVMNTASDDQIKIARKVLEDKLKTDQAAAANANRKKAATDAAAAALGGSGAAAPTGPSGPVSGTGSTGANGVPNSLRPPAASATGAIVNPSKPGFLGGAGTSASPIPAPAAPTGPSGSDGVPNLLRPTAPTGAAGAAPTGATGADGVPNSLLKPGVTGAGPGIGIAPQTPEQKRKNKQIQADKDALKAFDDAQKKYRNGDGAADAQSKADEAAQKAIAQRNYRSVSDATLDQADRAVDDAQTLVDASIKKDAEYWQRMHALDDAKLKKAQANRDAAYVSAQLGIDLTNPVQAAEAATDKAVKDLEAAKALDPTRFKSEKDREAYINDRKLAVVQARNSEAGTKQQAFLSNLQDADKYGRISHQAYIQGLDNEAKRVKQKLAKMQDTDQGYKQLQQYYDSLQDAAKDAANELSGQFNLGDIDLPSVYQVRRAMKGNDPGSVLKANGSSSTAGNVTNDSSSKQVILNGVPIQQVLKMIEDLFGVKARASAKRRYS